MNNMLYLTRLSGVLLLTAFFQGCYTCQMVTDDLENNNIVFSWGDTFPRNFSVRFLPSCELANFWDSCSGEEFSVEMDPGASKWLTMFPSNQEHSAATRLTAMAPNTISLRINWDLAPDTGALTYIRVLSEKNETFSVKVVVPPKPADTSP